MQFGPGVPGAPYVGAGGPFVGLDLGASRTTFDGVVAVKRELDTNYDGAIDCVYHFRRHAIERAEWDLDHDGVFDLRATYAEPADDETNLQYWVYRVENEYRLVPNSSASAYPAHEHGGGFYAGPAPRYEARIDGVWRDSFTLELPRTEWSSEQHAAQGVMTLVCDDGSAVSLTTAADPGANRLYQQTLYEDGKPANYLVGPAPDQPTRTIRYIYGDDPRIITRIDRDNDGELDYEISRAYAAFGVPDHETYYSWVARIMRDGEWTGTFVDRNRRHVDGRLIDVLWPEKEQVIEHRDYDDDGRLLWAYSDSDFDGEFDLRRGPDGTTHQRVDGAWVGDFKLEREGIENAMSRYTYRGGRLIHYQGESRKEATRWVIEYPEPGVLIVRTTGMGIPSFSKVWNYYEPERRGSAQKLVRSAFDLDSDATPDLFVDFHALTISETRPDGWPQ
ncbi:MAG: hypothetical protein ACE37H_03425 [Phycisphaeraceae bacterium]